ncbi:hypothetical protein TTHERM_00728900 (macronuclear) [Tetrahymena thermophila SB210]|uniref:Uncharacterized protein n=1 Tax=Tetrahymena thermophila (strain SB210) TaxID=312017 RepID=I7M9P6_TETTS|nr:hypothetical protein TTHERM_00728900 [Tetrahymena thermophila SB210]EAS02431.2 hypothetical protein TTHERM_00728900 [Tetrahymena thermophila SB210]|eukprot:XP_001022676.2 hypothetical protein TTHERM_00728900 [Tetrahymena thermophila SB210]
MENEIYCSIHKNKLIDAVCLEKECSENSLICYNCRDTHQDHIQSCIHLQDLIENIESRFNLSVVSNEFNFQLNKLKFLKEDYQQRMNKQKQKITQLIDKSLKEFNKSIDCKIQNIKQSYHSHIQFMQKFRNFGMNKQKENIFILEQAKNQFKISKKNEKNNSQMLNSLDRRQNSLEIVHQDLINKEFQQSQQYYQQIADDVIQYMNNFETLWRNQTKNSAFIQEISSPLTNSRTQINNTCLQKIHQDIENGILKKENPYQQFLQSSSKQNQQNIHNQIYDDEKRQIDQTFKNNYINRDYEQKFENNDQVVQINATRCEQSPKILKEVQAPLFGNFQQSIIFNQNQINDDLQQIGSQRLYNDKQNCFQNSSLMNTKPQQNYGLENSQAIKQYTFSDEQKFNRASSENLAGKKSINSQSTNTHKSSNRYQSKEQKSQDQQQQSQLDSKQAQV